MKISSQEEYGLRCILQLARQPEEAVTTADIADREALTGAYVAKLMAQMRETGLVDAVRGRGGGYMLSRPPQEITVGEVLSSFSGQLFEGEFCENHIGLGDACVHMGTGCSIKTLWGVLDSLIENVLSRTTLADLLSFTGLQQLREEHERLRAVSSSRVQ